MKDLTLFLTICLILAVATIAFAGDFYVSPDGDNSTGNNWQTAYQSISEALSKMKAGDRCYLKIGSYPVKEPLKPISGITLLGGCLGEGSPGKRNLNAYSFIDASQMESGALILDAADCEGTLLEAIGIAGGEGQFQPIEERQFRYIYKE